MKTDWQTVKEQEGVALQRLDLTPGGRSQWRVRAAEGVYHDMPDEAAGIARFSMETRRAVLLTRG